MAIHLTRDLLEGICEQGRQSYPEECCGFLVGQSDGEQKRVITIWPVQNEKEEGERRRRYLIAPRVVWESELRARREEVEILGVYHSHPDHPGEPSRFDREHAWPFFSYVIVEVRHGEPQSPLSWTLLEDRSDFLSEEIRVENSKER